MNIGPRLKEERERLGLSQELMGTAGGVLKRAVIHYEKGDRSPDAGFLAAIAAIGADVQYILTGVRLPEELLQHYQAAALITMEQGDASLADQFVAGLPEIQALQLELLAQFNACAPEDRKQIVQLAQRLSTTKKGKQK